jgi:hypothetical protein
MYQLNQGLKKKRRELLPALHCFSKTREWTTSSHTLEELCSVNWLLFISMYKCTIFTNTNSFPQNTVSLITKVKLVQSILMLSCNFLLPIEWSLGQSQACVKHVCFSSPNFRACFWLHQNECGLWNLKHHRRASQCSFKKQYPCNYVDHSWFC